MLRQHPVCLTHIAKKFSRFHQHHYLYEVKLGKKIVMLCENSHSVRLPLIDSHNSLEPSSIASLVVMTTRNGFIKTQKHSNM